MHGVHRPSDGCWFHPSNISSLSLNPRKETVGGESRSLLSPTFIAETFVCAIRDGLPSGLPPATITPDKMTFRSGG